jgi:hypothetical protein
MLKKYIGAISLAIIFIGYSSDLCFAAQIPLSEQDQLVAIISGDNENPPDTLKSGLMFRKLLIDRFESYWSTYVEPEKKQSEIALQQHWQTVEQKCIDLAKTGKYPYSQTEADFLARFSKKEFPAGLEQSALQTAFGGGIKINESISPIVREPERREYLLSEFKRALAEEKLYSPTHYVCYHGLSGQIGILNLVYQKIHNFKNLAEVHQLMLRFDTAINCFDATDLTDFLDKTQKIKFPFYYQWYFDRGEWKKDSKAGGNLFDHAPNIRDQLLSVNLSLFGNEQVIGENTLNYFIQGGSVFEQQSEEALNNLFEKLGLNKKFAGEIISLFYKSTGNPRLNLLYQFLIDKKYVDEVLYLSEKGGKPVGLLPPDIGANVTLLGLNELPQWFNWLRANNLWDDTPNPDSLPDEEPRNRIKNISAVLNQCTTHPRMLNVDAHNSSYSLLEWKQGRIWIPGLFKIPANAYKINIYYSNQIPPLGDKQLDQGLDRIFHEILQDYFIRMVLARGGYLKALHTASLLEKTRLEHFFSAQIEGALARLQKFMSAQSEDARRNIASEQYPLLRRHSSSMFLSQQPIKQMDDKSYADLFALRIAVDNGEKFQDAHAAAQRALGSRDTKEQVAGLRIMQALVEQQQEMNIALINAQEAITSNDPDVRNNARRLFYALFVRGEGIVEAKRKALELVQSGDEWKQKAGKNFLIDIHGYYKKWLCVRQQAVARRIWTSYK